MLLILIKLLDLFCRAEEVLSEWQDELKLVTITGVLAAIVTFLVGASLLLICLAFTWKHQAKLRSADVTYSLQIVS